MQTRSLINPVAKRTHGYVGNIYICVMVDKLTAILLMESYFNMVNKLLIGSRMIKKSENMQEFSHLECRGVEALHCRQYWPINTPPL